MFGHPGASVPASPRMRQIVEASIRRQTIFIKGTALMGMAMLPVGLVLMVMIPAKRGDLFAKIFVVGFFLALAAIGAGIWVWMSRQIRLSREILYEHPERITRLVPFELRRRNIRAYAVHFFDQRGRKYGLPVGSQGERDELIREIVAVMP